MTRYDYTDKDGATLEVTGSRLGGAEIAVGNVGETNFIYLPAERVEEVCSALREAAGLPPAWTVEKTSLDDDYDVTVREDGDVRDQGAVKLTPSGARLHAAQLLAAADEAEAREEGRAKLPAAVRSTVSVKTDGRDDVWVRLVNGSWGRAGDAAWMSHWDMQRQDFTILHDPEKAS